MERITEDRKDAGRVRHIKTKLSLFRRRYLSCVLYPGVLASWPLEPPVVPVHVQQLP